MNKNFLIAFLMLLTLAAPFKAAADSFYLKAADLEPGKTETLQFILENSQEYYGFQAEVTLPTGLQAMKGDDGELDITLSSRADDGEYNVNSNVLADGSIIMGAFSANLKPFTGNDGVLVSLSVSVSDDFAGGNVEISKIKFIDSRDKDVEFDSTSTSLGVAPAYQLGDVNGDGKVAAGDVVALVNCIVGNKPSFFIESVADVNNDGKIAAGDVVSVVNIIINK